MSSDCRPIFTINAQIDLRNRMYARGVGPPANVYLDAR